MKKLLLLLLTLFLSSNVTFGQSFNSGGINYDITSPTTVRVGGNSGFTGPAIIPPTVMNSGIIYTVTSISTFAFSNSFGLTSVVIPDTITSLALGTFINCTSLTTVTLPNLLTNTGESSFQNCTSLSSITIPNSVTSIDNYTFHGCGSLTSLNIPNSVMTIGDYAFNNCTGLTSVTIPNSVTSIGLNAFANCTGLTSVTIPNSVTSVGSAAFDSCTGLTSVTIPNSVTSIGISAFFNCTVLTSVTVNWVTPLAISNVFYPVSSATLHVPAGTVVAYKAATNWADFGSIVALTVPTATNPQVYAGTATIANLTATGTAIQWYAAATGGTALATSTALVDGTTYYASQTISTLESDRTPVTVQKISEATQTLCNPTTTSLVSTPTVGATANWFTTATGGTAMASTNAVATNNYYVEQAIPANVSSLGSGFNHPFGIAVQADGKIVVTNASTNSIIRMDADGTNIVTLAAGFNYPTGVAIQADGKILLADYYNNAIKRMDADGTNIVTLNSGFSGPNGIAVQVDGKIVVADTGNNAIERMDADGTNVEILGDGFYKPTGVAIQADGKIVVADYNNNAIKRMNADGTGIVTLGSGFYFPGGVAVQPDGKIVIADTYNGVIKRMDADGTNIVTLANNFLDPYGVAIQADGKIVVADINNSAVKKINSEINVSNRVAVAVTAKISAPPTAPSLQVYAGTSTVANLTATGTAIQWYPIEGPVIDPTTELVDGATYNATQTIDGCESLSTPVTVQKISEATQTLCGTATVANLVSTPTSNATANWFTTATGGTAMMNTDAVTTGTYYVEQPTPEVVTTLGDGFNQPTGVAIQADGQIVVADTSNNAIKRMNADGTGIVTLGNGFSLPTGVAFQADGKIVVADYDYSAIKRMNADGSGIETLVNGISALAIAIQADGKIVVVDSNAIKRMNADGSGIEILGSGFINPYGVAIQADGKIVVTDWGDNAIKRMNADGTGIETLGSGFSLPTGVAIQADGKIVVTDGDGVKRMDADGTNVVLLASGFGNLTGVAIQADGQIVVADHQDYVIQRITEANTSNRVAVNVTVNVTPAPTASVQSFCGSTTVASLVATGTALQWYDAATGGTALASTTALATGTYYVSQTLNSCESERTAVSVTANLLPTVDAGPATVTYCANAITPITAISAQTTSNGFQGTYAPANWTFVNGIPSDGNVNTTNAPASITITGGNSYGTNFGGLPGDSTYSIMVTTATTISFNWVYNTNHDPLYDYPQVIVNGNASFLQGYDTVGLNTQSGTMSISIPAGQTFAFNMFTADNMNGAATVTISNFVITNSDVSYSWAATNGGSITGATNTASMTPATSGTYTVTATNTAGCTATDSVAVTVNVTDNTVTQAAGVLTATQAGATYQWYQCPSTLLAGETNQTYTPTVAGDYKAEITLAGCTVTSSCITVSTLNNSSFEVSNKLKIYPNPTSGNVTIDFTNLNNVKLEVTDITGKEIMNQNLNANSNAVNIESLAIGSYMFKISSNEGTATSKVIKK